MIEFEDYTPEERQAAMAQLNQRLWDENLSKREWIVYAEDGYIIKRYKNGTKERLQPTLADRVVLVSQLDYNLGGPNVPIPKEKD